jgi:hypothetical protein
MSATATNVLPADSTQIITHAWSVGASDDFDSGYEVALINITPEYARKLLALVTVITEQLPPDTILVTPDYSAQYIDFERNETLEWSDSHPEVTVLVDGDRLSVSEIAPESNAGFPIPLGLRFIEISKSTFRYRAEREHGYDGECVITPDIPVAVLQQIVNPPAEVPH